MTASEDTIVTAYGRPDKAALLEAQNTYDTRTLLQAVDDLDKIVAATVSEDGLRDMLLRLHGMAHAVVNGAGLSVATDQDSLPELAFDAIAEMHEVVSVLQRLIKQIEPLERLQALD